MVARRLGGKPASAVSRHLRAVPEMALALRETAEMQATAVK